MIRTTGSRIKQPVDSLPDLQKAVAKRLFPDLTSLTPQDIQISLRELAAGPKRDIETEAALRDLLKIVSNPGEAVANAATDSVGQAGLGAVQSRSVDPVLNARQQEIADRVTAFEVDLDKKVKGQPGFKAALKAALAARLTERIPDPVPIPIVLGGPSGIGKSSGARALAQVLNDDPNAKVILFDCTEIGTSADLSKWKGAAPGYVGYGADRPINEGSLAKAGKRPVILVDEISRAGKGLPPDQRKALQEEIYSYFANYVDTGDLLDINNNPIEQLRGGTIIFTTNAGYDAKALANMTVDQKRDHYQSAALAEIPKQMVGRIGKPRVVGMDELTDTDIGAIFEAKLREQTDEMIPSVKKAEGFDVSFAPPSNELKEFVGRATESADFGTRNLVHMLRSLIQPILNTHEYADDGRYQLIIRPGTPELELERLITAFQSADGTPPGTDISNFPVKLKNLNARPLLREYTSQLPASDQANLIVLGSETVGGKTYTLINKGEFDSQNQMVRLEPGGNIKGMVVPDAHVEVALPPELANALPGAYTARIDENRMWVMGMQLPENGDEPVTFAFIFDATNKKKPWSKVSSPPFALWGAGVGGIDGKVIMRGGRNVEKTETGWSPQPEIELNSGSPMQGYTLVYDPTKDDGKSSSGWSELSAAKSGPQAPRSGYAVREHKGQLLFAGGEVRTEGAPGTLPFSMGSTAVDIYDPKTGSFIEGPELAHATAYAMAVSTGDNFEVMGGHGLLLNRATGNLSVTPQTTIQTLNTGNAEPSFKVRLDQQLPGGASGLQQLAVPGGQLLGPFFEPRSFTPIFKRYSVPEGD